MSFCLSSKQSFESPFIGFSLTPMSINLGSERRQIFMTIIFCLTPMSFNLGSERISQAKESKACLTPMSFQLGSEQQLLKI